MDSQFGNLERTKYRFNGIADLLFILLVGFTLVWSNLAWAINASPHPFEAVQPDGGVIVLRVQGDEFLHWQTDEAGYAVVRDAQDRYVYAVKDAQGSFAPTQLVVGEGDPAGAGLTQGLRPEIGLNARSGALTPQPLPLSPQGVTPLGTVNNLEVMIRFSDHAARILPSTGDMEVLFNTVGGDSVLAPTGSVKDVYLENSYNQLTLESTVTVWITLSQTEAYYADGVSGSSKLWEGLREALDILDADANFHFTDFDVDNDNQIDAIGFLHSGYGAEWDGNPNHIWSHRWSIQPAWTSSEGVSVGAYHIEPALWGTSGSDIGHIGVIAHEIGHFFGLPDLYDTDGSSSGIGSWAMMANSWGFDGSQYYPPHFSAWSKIFLNWVTPTVISAAGNYLLDQVEFNPEIYRIDAGYPSGEYLLLENRQPVGVESIIPQGGLAIWHIDEPVTTNRQEGFPGQTGWPANGNHYKVALLQADGNFDLEHRNGRGDDGDLWHLASNPEISDITVPGTFSYQGGSVVDSGNRLCNFSASSASMNFDFNDCNATTPLGALDVDGDGSYDALTDGLLIIRYLFGFTGATLLDGAVGVSCSRCTATQIEAHLASLAP